MRLMAKMLRGILFDTVERIFYAFLISFNERTDSKFHADILLHDQILHKLPISSSNFTLNPSCSYTFDKRIHSFEYFKNHTQFSFLLFRFHVCHIKGMTEAGNLGEVNLSFTPNVDEVPEINDIEVGPSLLFSHSHDDQPHTDGEKELIKDALVGTDNPVFTTDDGQQMPVDSVNASVREGDRTKDKEDESNNEEDENKNEDEIKNEEDISKNEEDVSTNEEDESKNEEDISKNEKDISKNEEDENKNEEDVIKKIDDVQMSPSAPVKIDRNGERESQTADEDYFSVDLNNESEFDNSGADLKRWKASLDLNDSTAEDNRTNKLSNGNSKEGKNGKPSPFKSAFFLSKYLTFW